MRNGRSYTCQQRHNFDVSADGYLGLLHGRSNHQQAGDDKPMVQARVRVHKLPVFHELAKAIADVIPPADAGCGILDIGSGDGFFLDQASRAGGVSRPGIGIDVSKEAVARAARSHPGLFFIRADVAHSRLPFGDGSFGLVLSVFAPRPMDEIRRVLRDDGSWLVVTATQDHLKELRPHLPLAAIGTGKLDELDGRSFGIKRSVAFSRELPIERADLVSIVEMSPSVFRLRREFGETWRERVPAGLRVTFSFSLTLLGKAVR